MNEEGKQVSYEDLDAALEADPDYSAEEFPEEPQEPEESEDELDEQEPEPEDDDVPAEPEDNAERSKLGRRVAAMEENLTNFTEQMALFMKNFTSGNQRGIPNEPEIPEDDYDPGDLMTKGDFEKMLKKATSQQSNEINKYNADYNSVFTAQEAENGKELHKEIMDELVANHNFKRSNDGLKDAELNYKDAMIAVLKAKTNIKTNPLEKNKDKTGDGLGTPSETVTPGKAGTPIKLDAFAQEFVRNTGMSEKSIKEALSQPASGGLNR